MKTWSAFLPDVRPKAPGIPESIAEHAVLRAAQDFCDQTRVWQLELDPVTTQDGVLEYDIELGTGTELVRLESATLNGEPYAVWRKEGVACDSYVNTPDGKTIEFSRPVEAGAVLVLRCSVKPGNRAAGIADAIYDRYVGDIALLAVAELKDDEGKRQAYQRRVDRIKTQLWRGNAAIRPRSRPSLF
ncbi:hypothetical protein [Variovorax sp. dw_954]|uniref:hypothetical protein n=1 Tax=Variovorax sp. dw_954 TaxID=2720078 RepID=UPI001BD66795|nr:hypothetical protein [Variovorax sp. dw_954]